MVHSAKSKVTQLLLAAETFGMESGHSIDCHYVAVQIMRYGGFGSEAVH